MYTLCLLSLLFASGFQIYLHVPQTIILMWVSWSTALWQEVNLKANSVTKFCNHRLTKSPYRGLCRIYQRFYFLLFYYFFFLGYVWWNIPQAFDCTSHSIKNSATSAFQCRCSWEYTRQRPQKDHLQERVTFFWTWEVQKEDVKNRWISRTHLFSFLHHDREYFYFL